MPRQIARIVETPLPAPGFIGEGHTAVPVVTSDALTETDPFVLLMDDRLDIAARRQIGGPHPHANIETVTLLLDGVLWDRDEGELRAGDAVWMTAGRGVIHNEAVETVGRSRVLQLWIALPERDRELAPQFEIIRKDTAPVVRAPGVEARLYSGTSGALRSPTRNRVPITMVDLALGPHARYDQLLPASHRGFLYVVEGAVVVGARPLTQGQVGWLDRPDGRGEDTLPIVAGEGGARVVLYAGQPLGEPLVQYGPFVGASRSEIAELYRRFRAGRFEPLSAVARCEHEGRVHA